MFHVSWAIALASNNRGLRAHSIRGMLISCALIKGVNMSDICAAAGLFSVNVFIRFYHLDMLFHIMRL